MTLSQLRIVLKAVLTMKDFDIDMAIALVGGFNGEITDHIYRTKIKAQRH